MLEIRERVYRVKVKGLEEIVSYRLYILFNSVYINNFFIVVLFVKFCVFGDFSVNV